MKSFNKIVAMLLLAVAANAGAVLEFKTADFSAATPEKQTEMAQTLLDNAKKEFPKTYGAEIAKVAKLDVEKLVEACPEWAIENLTPEILKTQIIDANKFRVTKFFNDTMNKASNVLTTAKNGMTWDNVNPLTYVKLGWNAACNNKKKVATVITLGGLEMLAHKYGWDKAGLEKTKELANKVNNSKWATSAKEAIKNKLPVNEVIKTVIVEKIVEQPILTPGFNN